MNKIKRALISVWDKTGIIELAEFLISNQIEIISTGGTKKNIRKKQYSCYPCIWYYKSKRNYEWES